jgi:hypothetical protein
MRTWEIESTRNSNGSQQCLNTPMQCCDATRDNGETRQWRNTGRSFTCCLHRVPELQADDMLHCRTEEYGNFSVFAGVFCVNEGVRNQMECSWCVVRAGSRPVSNLSCGLIVGGS